MAREAHRGDFEDFNDFLLRKYKGNLCVRRAVKAFTMDMRFIHELIPPSKRDCAWRIVTEIVLFCDSFRVSNEMIWVLNMEFRDALYSFRQHFQ